MLAKHMQAQRVTVSAPHITKTLHGTLVGTYQNARGKWINVKIDGCNTTRFFWHEYVSSSVEAA